MSDKLEKYIRDNRDELNILEPSLKIWEKIDAHGSKKSFNVSSKSLIKYFGPGAVVIACIVLLILNIYKKKQYEEKAVELKAQENVRSLENTSLKQANEINKYDHTHNKENVSNKINTDSISIKAHNVGKIEKQSDVGNLNNNLTGLINNDFENAIEIRDSVFGPTNVSIGYGKELEFSSTIHPDMKEENSAWFKFTISRTGTLTMDIVPQHSEDYDFILFKCSDENCINELKQNKLIPERICFSIKGLKNSPTGLSEYATDTLVSWGRGTGYAKAVSVKAGETYYLMVTNPLLVNHSQYFGPGGFTIYFYNNWPKKKPILLKQVEFLSNETDLSPQSFSELDLLALELLKDRRMVIEVRGHTDNEGQEQTNFVLSTARAKAVRNYIVGKGIEEERVLYKGYGSTMPVATNKTSDGRKKNRRVEYVLIMR